MSQVKRFIIFLAAEQADGHHKLCAFKVEPTGLLNTEVELLLTQLQNSSTDYRIINVQEEQVSSPKNPASEHKCSCITCYGKEKSNAV